MKLKYRKVTLTSATEQYISTFQVGVKKASDMLGMSESTLKHSAIPCTHTGGGHRRYKVIDLINIATELTKKKPATE